MGGEHAWLTHGLWHHNDAIPVLWLVTERISGQIKFEEVLPWRQNKSQSFKFDNFIVAGLRRCGAMVNNFCRNSYFQRGYESVSCEVLINISKYFVNLVRVATRKVASRSFVFFVKTPAKLFLFKFAKSFVRNSDTTLIRRWWRLTCVSPDATRIQVKRFISPTCMRHRK